MSEEAQLKTAQDEILRLRLNSLLQLQYDAGSWANRVFGKGQTITGIINHLIKEVCELRDSDSPDEAADCLLLLCQHAHECGYNLIEEARKKHQINLNRKWGKPDEYGVIEHTREPLPKKKGWKPEDTPLRKEG